MSFTWQGSGESEAEAETTALENSFGKPVQAEKGEASLSLDSYTGLPKLPIELVESEDELDEISPTVTFTLWYYNHERGTLTEVMSKSPSKAAPSITRNKSVTFDDRAALKFKKPLMKREVEGSGSEQHPSITTPPRVPVPSMDKSKSDSYLALTEKERNDVAMAQSPHGLEKKARSNGRPSSLLKSNRSRSVYIRLQKSTPSLLRKSSFILGDRETDLRASPIPSSLETSRRSSSTGTSVSRDNCSPDSSHHHQDDVDTSSIDGDDVNMQRRNSHLGRRSSYLYLSDSDEQEEACGGSGRILSRVTSLASHVGDETYVTPFAQILATLHRLRSQYIALVGPESSKAVHNRPGWASPYPESAYDRKILANDILEELDWCLKKLEGVSSTKSMGNMANEKFRRLLSRELSQLSEKSKEGAQVAEWMTDLTNLDGDLDRVLDSMHDLMPPAKPNTASDSPTPPWIRKTSKHSNVVDKEITQCDRIPVYGVDSARMDKKAMEKFAEKDGEFMRWSMDIFNFNQISGENPLICATYLIFKERNIFSKFKILPRKFLKYISAIQNLYHSKNPYHNALHGTDVFLSANHLLKSTTLDGVFSDLEVFATLVAAAVHDVDHPGLTNQFLVAVGSDLAILYNDKSVLENHHVATAFKTLQEPDCNFLEGFETSQRMVFRRIVIDLVLATDMAKHIEHLAEMKTLLETKHVANDGILVLNEYSERLAVLQCLIHCSDLSNPTKSKALATQWTHCIMEEFFLQGDTEKKLNMPMHAAGDRNNVSVANCQISFIDFIVLPLWEMWMELVYPADQEILDNITTVREHWAATSYNELSSTVPANKNTERETPSAGDSHTSTTKLEDVSTANPEDISALKPKDQPAAKSGGRDDSAKRNGDKSALELGDRSAAESVTYSATKSGDKPSTECGTESTTLKQASWSRGQQHSQSADAASLREQLDTSARERRLSYRTCYKSSINAPIGEIVPQPAEP